MDPGAGSSASGTGEGPSSSSGGGDRRDDPAAQDTAAAEAAAAAAAPEHPTVQPSDHRQEPPPQQQLPSRYESQKRRDWNTFLQYLKNHKPPLTLARCCGSHVIEFLKYLDQFGKTKVHAAGCPYFGRPNPPAPCACPLMQAWGSLDALIGRLRAAYEESGGRPESNPFAHRAVRVYLREVRESQAKARGIPYEKKKRKRNNQPPNTAVAAAASQPSLSSTIVGGTTEVASSTTGVGGTTKLEGGGELSSTATASAVTSTSAAGCMSSGVAGKGSGAPPPEGSSAS